MFDMRPSVCCLFVCPEHNSKTNDPKVFKLGIRMTLRCPRSDAVLGLKGQSHGLKVNKCIFHTTTAFIDIR